MSAWCMVVDQQWKGKQKKVKIMGYMTVPNEQAHHWAWDELVTGKS